MKRILILFFICPFAFSYAQTNVLNAENPSEFGQVSEEQIANDNDKPLPYGYVAEKDRLWQRMVWEIIDLDERVNFPLLYPVDTARVGTERRSLFHVLSAAAENNEIPIYDGSYFNSKKDPSAVQAALSAVKVEGPGINMMQEQGLGYSPVNPNYIIEYAALIEQEKINPTEVDAVFGINGFDQYVSNEDGAVVISEEGLNVLKQNRLSFYNGDVIQGVYVTDAADVYGIPEFKEQVSIRTLQASDVLSYKIRGLWYFDARQSELRYRLIGICPMTIDVNFPDQLDGIELFWVYFPHARQILHDAKAFNSGNSARPISFDHLLNTRRFSALVIKTDNVYGDREIGDYIKDNSMMRLLESQRLNEDIRNFELEMWNN
ncbi:MAG: gliding motility protein GldN [Nonlabens sp.]